MLNLLTNSYEPVDINSLYTPMLGKKDAATSISKMRFIAS